VDRSRQNGFRLAAASIIGTMAVLTMLSVVGAVGAGATSTTTTTTTSTTTSTTTTTYASKSVPPAAHPTTRFNSGTPNSTIRIFNSKGELIQYGNQFVRYTLPSSSLIPYGEALYSVNCAACHGPDANGHPTPGTPGGPYPNLLGLGPATYSFWINSGRMPAAQTPDIQAVRRNPKLSPYQASAVAAYINSLQPATPYVPVVNLSGADLSDGAQLFSLNCAACHTITGDGDALAWNTYAPSLRHVPAQQVAEALRTGPANMPVFTGNLTDRQLRDVVAYVTQKIQHPQNPGGLGLGGLGPVGEGFIGLALGVGLLALVGFWVGDRT
jgi:ubiquinol-cytochrome c reductase cytochrome c subunit